MKLLFNYKITDRVANQIESEHKKPLNKITEEELKALLNDFLVDSEKEYVWTEEDIHYICSLEFGSEYDKYDNAFYEVRELGIYIAEDWSCSQLYNYGEIGDTDNFIEGYLTYYTGNWDYLMESIYKIDWADEENICKKAVDDLIKKYEDEKDGEDTIEFHGLNGGSLESEIDNYLKENGYDADGDYVIGTYLGKEIFKIKDKLYYLDDDSWTYNNEYHWYLQEVGKKCYEYFGYNK